ncbi:unnamed protein product [Periconia digitata]|uniref:Response regulatory domain-containing protein n=1 Tax=Periconia digitata TaxID=1303443 RepID=A0A9W4USI8_9PLEO|nr:unnamed protein product [Periconia digitata]
MSTVTHTKVQPELPSAWSRATPASHPVQADEVMAPQVDQDPTGDPLLEATSTAPHTTEPPTSTTQSILSSTTPAQFKRLLLVESNGINLKVLCFYVKKLRLPFVTATNGAEAVRLYTHAILGDKDPFDCVLMGLSMPVMDGFQAVQAIRQFEMQQATDKNAPNDGGKVCSRSYVIALTASVVQGTHDTAIASGFDDVLTKPIMLKKVAEALDAGLRNAN